MKNRRTRRIVFIVVLMAIIGSGAGIALRFYNADSAEVEELSSVPVVVGTPTLGEVEEILRYPGTLVSRDTVTLVPSIGGKVERILAAEGDLVRAGEVLVRIEVESAAIQANQALSAWRAAEAQYRKAEKGVRDAELENAQASLGQAEEDLAAAERNFERSKRLYEAGTIAKATFEDAENALGAARTQLENAGRSVRMMEEGASTEELDMAKANAEAAESQYELAKLQLDYGVITAPVSGIVGKVLVDEGNMVGPGTPLLAIVQQDPIEVCVQIPEKHYGKFSSDGTSATIRVWATAYPDREAFAGTVTSVAPIIDPASRTFEVCAAIPNRQGLLKPGMYVNTELITGSEDNLLMVPDTAVVLRDDRPVVFVVKNGRTLEVEVRLGVRDNRMVVVAGDISVDDTVVFEGNAFLESGQAVEVVNKR